MCITSLKSCGLINDHRFGIRCIAWLCVLANADGFMDRAEWQFIYKIYHRELQLPLDVIMGVQKELMRKISAAIVDQIAPQLITPRLALF